MFFFLMLPAGLYANHFRYGTMSWEPISDNGTHITIRLKMQNGWTADHSQWDDYSKDDINTNYITIYWGDGTDTSQTVEGVPGLMDIPYLGKLFSSESTTSTKTELMIFITPHIISTVEDSKIATEEMRKRLSSIKGHDLRS